MIHVCGRASSDKERVLNVFKKQLNARDKNGCSVSTFTTHCKYLNHSSKTGVHQKMKRLKSRKERSQMRGGGKEASKSKSHHCHCHRQSSRQDMAHFLNCCQSSCRCSSRRDAQFPHVVPAAQEPSIITGRRLIGHHGLFNHEVKSIDIDRLLSEQGNLEKSGQEEQEKNNATPRPSSTSHIPAPFSSDYFLVADSDEVMPFEKKSDPAMKSSDECLEKKNTISHGLDVTPGQRQQRQLDLSSGGFKSILSSKHSSLDVVIVKSKKTNSVMSEKGKDSQLTPNVDTEIVRTLNEKVKGRTISTMEQTPKKQESPVHQPQAGGLSPSPLLLSSANTADSFDLQHRRQDTDCVSKSVSALAAGLCDCLQFPLRRRRNLLAESRALLLKALRERHGPQLQENLLEVQQGLSFGTGPAKKVHDQEPTRIDEDELLPTDAFTTVSQFKHNTASCPWLDTQRTTSFKMKGSRYFSWTSSPQLQQNLKQTAEWLASPVETFSLLDDILRPVSPPQFCTDFEPSGVTVSDDLFAPSTTSCWGETASASHHWEDRINRPKSKEAVMFDSFENSFRNHTREVTKRSSGSQYGDSNIQRFFPYQAQLPDRHSAEPMYFAHEQDHTETERYSFVPSFSAQIHHPQRSNYFQPFSHFSHPSTCPPLRSQHTDMIHYPPSHMLERDPAPPLSSLPSPEHWSFPPMRLY